MFSFRYAPIAYPRACHGTLLLSHLRKTHFTRLLLRAHGEDHGEGVVRSVEQLVCVLPAVCILHGGSLETEGAEQLATWLDGHEKSDWVRLSASW